MTGVVRWDDGRKGGEQGENEETRGGGVQTRYGSCSVAVSWRRKEGEQEVRLDSRSVAAQDSVHGRLCPFPVVHSCLERRLEGGHCRSWWGDGRGENGVARCLRRCLSSPPVSPVTRCPPYELHERVRHSVSGRSYPCRQSVLLPAQSNLLALILSPPPLSQRLPTSSTPG